jgi:hypothetical protein
MRFLALVGLLFCLLLAAPADANAPAPPNLAWFNFEPSMPVQGVQLVECGTATCDRPTLLKQSGICRDSGCLPAAPQLAAHRFDCAANTCLYVEESFVKPPQGPMFKLIVQTDRVITTPPFQIGFETTILGANRRFRVTRTDAALTIMPDTAPKPSRSELFWVGLGLTQMTELVVAALFGIWKKLERSALIKLLAAIAWINLLTFPVVWLLFPALQPFQQVGMRHLGGLSLLVAIGYSLWLATRATVTLKLLLRMLLTWIITLPLVGFVALIFTYGQAAYVPAGLPGWVTLTASELFAWGWEAWLIYRVGRSHLSVSQAILLSLLTNAASLILGLILLPALQQIG